MATVNQICDCGFVVAHGAPHGSDMDDVGSQICNDLLSLPFEMAAKDCHKRRSVRMGAVAMISNEPGIPFVELNSRIPSVFIAVSH